MMDTLAAAPLRSRPTPPPISTRKLAGRLNALSIACLRLAAPCESLPAWRRRLDEVVRAYGSTAVAIRLDDLQARGYLTDGLPRVGFLTEKGRAALERWS